MSKLDTRPSKTAVKTKWGWQDSVTGELLVSAPGYFKDVEADSERPSSVPVKAEVKQDSEQSNKKTKPRAKA